MDESVCSVFFKDLSKEIHSFGFMNYLQFLNNEEFWIFGSKVRQEDVKTENLGGPLP